MFHVKLIYKIISQEIFFILKTIINEQIINIIIKKRNFKKL